jgi:methylphosphotriester-DNA--protein-cysteine methyltransferase
MIAHAEIDDRSLRMMIHNRALSIGANARLKIYGTLSCRSGKRMTKKNRVFFNSEEEAVSKGYRPCSNCMRQAYRHWKTKQRTDDE